MNGCTAAKSNAPVSDGYTTVSSPASATECGGQNVGTLKNDRRGLNSFRVFSFLKFETDSLKKCFT